MTALRDIIRNWLGVKDPIPTRDWSAEFEEFKKENWKLEQIIKERVAGKCGYCGKKLMMWPYETEAYYTRDDKAYHVKCYDKMLDQGSDNG